MERVERLAALLSYIWLLVLYSSGQVHSILSADFYDSSCPDAEAIVREGVETALESDKRIAASLLRLHFHDCFVLGCDASVLLDGTSAFASEKTSLPNNNSLRGFDVVDSIKAALEEECPRTVSCADLLAIAAMVSVDISGGGSYAVLLGRRDGTTASAADSVANLPSPFLNETAIVAKFAKFNLSEHDMITLSGAHTIGRARCQNIKSRLYPTVEAGLDAKFADTLKKACPENGSTQVVTDLDQYTPDKFDNQYFINIKKGEGVLHSDSVLLNAVASNAGLVSQYSSSQNDFWKNFGVSIIKMGNIGVLEGKKGQIRTNCRFVNSGSLIASE